MIIKSGTELGSIVKIYNENGTEVSMFITEYDTVTREALIYKKGPDGKLLMTDWISTPSGGKKRDFITEKVLLDGSYAKNTKTGEIY